ncbi:MAG TPA: SurA N-terminal domain-containing protein [Caldimonas sp.]|nr:SurA N-terminal domain-containing protein [Caldimonas sp.]
MFDFFRRHTRVLQFVLVLLVFPSFVFFGIQGYSRFSGNDQKTVATVAGQPISQDEFDNAMRDRIDRARRQMPNLDAKLFDTPQMRQLALDAMIRERVLLAAADKLHLAPGDERLDKLFKSDPQFAQFRNPDGSLNKDMVAALGLSSEGFAAQLRQDMARQQVLQGLNDSVLAPEAATAAALDAMYQQREVQVERFDTKSYLDKVSPTDAQIEAYYKDPANAAQFRAPEQESIDYVVLDPEAMKKGLTISDADLKKYYDENVKRYTTPEERKASHILVKADKDAPKAERDKARAKAEALLAEVRKDPASFAEIAKKNSDDEGSASKGGELDWFGKGAMVKPFEDAAFALKPGEISGIVPSDFGFHIIRLDAIRGGQVRPFAEVRPEIESEIRNQLAQKRFSDAAVEFGDTVYEQPDSLKPAADKWQLEIKKAEHVTRQPAPGASGPLANARFLEALFSSDATKSKHNTKAIDIGSNQLVSGHVTQYTPAHQLPLADVKDRIRTQLATMQAAALAKKAGMERLEAARAAPAKPVSSNTLIVSRAQSHDLQASVVDAVLKAPAAKLPAFVGVDLGSAGYDVVKITKLWGRDPGFADLDKARSQYGQVWSDAVDRAYYDELKSRFKVKINEAALASSGGSTEDR